MNIREFEMTVIVIFNNGRKRTRDVVYHRNTRNGVNVALASYGSNLRFDGIKIEDINKVVVINGTDVLTYEGGEPAEILGL